MGTLTYHHNNSGGSDWLSKDDWKALAAAGWKLEDFGDLLRNADGSDHYYGAEKEFDSAEEGIAEWSTITRENPKSLGCSCCGPPPFFHLEEWRRLGILFAAGT